MSKALARFFPSATTNGLLLPTRTVTGRRLLSISTTRLQQSNESPNPKTTSAPPSSASPPPSRPNRDDVAVRLSGILRDDSRHNHNYSKKITVAIGSDYISLDTLLLRDSCKCAECVDPSTTQKTFQTSDIHHALRARRSWQDPNTGELTVQWNGPPPDPNQPPPALPNRHQSTYSLEQLRTLASIRSSMRANHDDMSYVLWDGEIMRNSVHFIPYDEYMSNDEALYFALKQLMVYGLVFLKNVPKDDPQAVEGIAQRVGTIKDTFYGRTWDVKSIPNSKNVAYTQHNLGLHMDLLYYESPPGLQFLHCIQNDATGGNSYFADSFRAAEMLRLSSSLLFGALTKWPVTFHYHNDGHHYRYTRPTVVLDTHGYNTQRPRFAHVNYAPPFQAPFEFEPVAGGHVTALWRQFVHAITSFAKLIEAPENQYEMRLRAGEVAIFQNRRVLHARRAFDAQSGERWLKGTYVDGDTFRSRWRVLADKYRKTREEAAADARDFTYIK